MLGIRYIISEKLLFYLFMMDKCFFMCFIILRESYEIYFIMFLLEVLSMSFKVINCIFQIFEREILFLYYYLVNILFFVLYCIYFFYILMDYGGEFQR